LLTNVATDSRYMINRFQAPGLRATVRGVDSSLVIAISPEGGDPDKPPPPPNPPDPNQNLFGLGGGSVSIIKLSDLVQVDWRRLN
jgi:hypothetical protein